MTLEELNRLSRTEAALGFSHCCGSSQWAKQMAQKRPFDTDDELFSTADSLWRRLSTDDWKEAFSAHPKIGDLGSVQQHSVPTTTWAQGEQAGASNASEMTLQLLAKGNAEYEKKFGYIFIVCATGKSADEMLAVMKQRLNNDPASELHIAAEEQRKITRLRLQKLLDSQP